MSCTNCFIGLKERLAELGFEPTKLPWRMESTHYTIVQVEEGCHGGPLFSITVKRYDEPVFRGRIPNAEYLDSVFMLVKEAYLLNDAEEAILKTVTPAHIHHIP